MQWSRQRWSLVCAPFVATCLLAFDSEGCAAKIADAPAGGDAGIQLDAAATADASGVVSQARPDAEAPDAGQQCRFEGDTCVACKCAPTLGTRVRLGSDPSDDCYEPGVAVVRCNTHPKGQCLLDRMVACGTRPLPDGGRQAFVIPEESSSVPTIEDGSGGCVPDVRYRVFDVHKACSSDAPKDASTD